MPPTTNRAPAPDRASPQRRALLAKIHIARKQLGIEEDDYRTILREEAGRASAADCTEAALEKVLARLQRLGFKPLPSKRGAASHPMARKARALWISLHQLGVVRNPSEQALEAFAKRQLECEKLVWARQSEAFKLIEALKDMANRAGWRQVGPKGEKLSALTLQSSLALLLLDRLQQRGAVPADWSLATAAWRLGKLRRTDSWTIVTYAQAAAILGEQLRALKGEGE